MLTYETGENIKLHEVGKDIGGISMSIQNRNTSCHTQSHMCVGGLIVFLRRIKRN